MRGDDYQMITVQMPKDDFNFIARFYAKIDINKYVSAIKEVGDYDICLCFSSQAIFTDFQVEYNAIIATYGMDNYDTVNKTGIRLEQIYDQYVMYAEYPERP